MANDPVPWLILSSIPGLGPVGISTLIAHLKTPENILTAPLHHLQQIEGIGPHLARAIAHNQNIQNAHTICRTAQLKDMNIVTLTDAAYPCHLRQIFAPPPVLFYRGHLDVCNKPTIAIVGSRSFTPYGKNITSQLASELVQLGITIVSGMAVGTDTHAHRGALNQNGATVAVLGSSLLITCIYPHYKKPQP